MASPCSGRPTSTSPPFNYYQLGPNTSYLVDIFGGQRRAVEQMQALADYQQAELQAATLTLIGDVILHCLTIAATHAEQQAVDRIVADDERTLDLVRQAYAAGAAGQTEILSAQSQLAADRTLLPPLSQQLAVARHALAILVGSAPANWTVPDFTLVEFKLAARVPLTLPAELVRHRPRHSGGRSRVACGYCRGRNRHRQSLSAYHPDGRGRV
jgi:outer membrane protein TolC